MAHWSEKFLGVGYDRVGEGPDLYSCWAFVRWVQREQFNRNVPFMAVPQGLLAAAKAIPYWAARCGWTETERPETGDVASLRVLRRATHIGIYVGDLAAPRILHCGEGGAALHTFGHLRSQRWAVSGYYRFAGS